MCKDSFKTRILSKVIQIKLEAMEAKNHGLSSVAVHNSWRKTTRKTFLGKSYIKRETIQFTTTWNLLRLLCFLCLSVQISEKTQVLNLQLIRSSRMMAYRKFTVCIICYIYLLQIVHNLLEPNLKNSDFKIIICWRIWYYFFLRTVRRERFYAVRG